jgi:PleD family two-component response regulator
MIIRYNFDTLSDLSDALRQRFPLLSDVVSTFHDHLADALEKINDDYKNDIRIVDDQDFQREYFNNFLEALQELQP